MTGSNLEKIRFYPDFSIAECTLAKIRVEPDFCQVEICQESDSILLLFSLFLDSQLLLSSKQNKITSWISNQKMVCLFLSYLQAEQEPIQFLVKCPFSWSGFPLNGQIRSENCVCFLQLSSGRTRAHPVSSEGPIFMVRFLLK